MSIEMRTDCQRNVRELATNHLSARGLCSQSMIVCGTANLCAGRGCALIRQLAIDRVKSILANV